MLVKPDAYILLGPYRDLLAKIDRLLDRIRRRYSAQIACTKGCPCGCRNLSVFPIEALSLAAALRELPREMTGRIRKRAAKSSLWDCSLLEDRACVLYPVRPIICRTHGFPLQTMYNQRPALGCCRHNFKNMPSIPADAVIDLDPINRELRTINTAAVTELAHVLQLPDRLQISDAILLAVS